VVGKKVRSKGKTEQLGQRIYLICEVLVRS